MNPLRKYIINIISASTLSLSVNIHPIHSIENSNNDKILSFLFLKIEDENESYKDINHFLNPKKG